MLLQIFDFGRDVAIEAPRVNSLHPESSFDDHRAQPGVLEVEEIAWRRGHRRTEAKRSPGSPSSPYGISTGIVAVGIDPATGALRGGADPRRERYVVAW